MNQYQIGMFVISFSLVAVFAIWIIYFSLNKRRREKRLEENWTILVSQRPADEFIVGSIVVGKRVIAALFLVLVVLIILLVYNGLNVVGWTNWPTGNEEVGLLLILTLIVEFGLWASLNSREYWLFEEGINEHAHFKGDLFFQWKDVDSVACLAIRGRYGVYYYYFQIRSDGFVMEIPRETSGILRLVNSIDLHVTKEKWKDLENIQQTFQEIRTKGK